MDWPLELAEGFVGSIEVAVPWAALLTDHCTVRVSGLQLTLQPRQGPGEGWASGGGRWAWASRSCLNLPFLRPSFSPQGQGLLTHRAGVHA
jgi:autophagy-related protein 2